MLFSSSTNNKQENNYSSCYGCGLCALVCPVWQHTRDVSSTPHGHAKALQFGGEINVDGLYACILCGACEIVCPENINLIDMMTELRIQNNKADKLLDNKNTENKNKYEADILFIADEALANHSELLNKVVELLDSVEVAYDNGSDLAQALQNGTEISPDRLDQFLEPIKHVSKLVVSDGLLFKFLKQSLPDIKITSLGYELSRQSTIQKTLSSKDLYIIESNAYHANFNKMVNHYDKLRRNTGCSINLDLQRLAIPTGAGHADFDTNKQCQWIIQGLNINRVVVESIEDGIALESATSKPVIHLSELLNN